MRHMSKNTSKGRISKVPLTPMPLIEEPFKRVVIDLVGPIYPTSSDGHKYILTFVDYATRYPEATSLKSITAVKVGEDLVNIFMRLGIPEEVVSDQGTQFTSGCMKEITRLLGLKQIHASSFHSMTSGLVEKFNGTLKIMLRTAKEVA